MQSLLIESFKKNKKRDKQILHLLLTLAEKEPLVADSVDLEDNTRLGVHGVQRRNVGQSAGGHRERKIDGEIEKVVE